MTAEESNPSSRITRLAPSPTGALHLGNVRTFLINYAHAKQTGARIILRVEDLDTPRVKPGADRGAIELLSWLGIGWDTGPIYQTTALSPYQAALDQLATHGQAYPCSLSRADIERAAISAPDATDDRLEHDARYPGLSRQRIGQPIIPLGQVSDDNTRLLVPDEATSFVDRVAGTQAANVQKQVGDFLIATKAGLPSYQLAVVIDDASQGVTDVVRGDDLIPSTHRQIWLQKLLGLPTPAYWHVPLIIGTDGKRLAKRHGDTRLTTYRQRGVAQERVIGLMAHWCGLIDAPSELSLSGFVKSFAWQQLPPEPIVFTPDHEQWLCAHC